MKNQMEETVTLTSRKTGKQTKLNRNELIDLIKGGVRREEIAELLEITMNDLRKLTKYWNMTRYRIPKPAAINFGGDPETPKEKKVKTISSEKETPAINFGGPVEIEKKRPRIEGVKVSSAKPEVQKVTEEEKLKKIESDQINVQVQKELDKYRSELEQGLSEIKKDREQLGKIKHLLMDVLDKLPEQIEN